MDAQAILVVEDEVLIRMSIADDLRDAGYQVVEAASGDDAMAVLLSSRDIDLIITDVRMPGKIDGMDLMARSKGMVPSRPVMVMSAHLLPEEAFPADEFLPKPYEHAALLSRFDRLIGPPCQNRPQNHTA